MMAFKASVETWTGSITHSAAGAGLRADSVEWEFTVPPPPAAPPVAPVALVEVRVLLRFGGGPDAADAALRILRGLEAPVATPHRRTAEPAPLRASTGRAARSVPEEPWKH